MRIAIIAILSVFIIFLGVQVYLFHSRIAEVGVEYQKISEELRVTKENEERLQADFAYYLNPLNLEKELRARFNYRSPEEKMLIIVPQASSANP
jgi:hypothetical protein